MNPKLPAVLIFAALSVGCFDPQPTTSAPNSTLENQGLRMITDKAELRQALLDHQLESRADLFLDNAVPAYYLLLGEKETYSRTGNSRVGGVPDLPRSWTWPRAESGYLNFIMQINLAELMRFDGSPLPESGILYYFVETEENGDFTRVLFFDGDASELRRSAGFPDDQFLCEYFTVLEPHGIVAKLGLDVPGFGSAIADDVMDAAGDNENGSSTDRFAAFELALKGTSDQDQCVGQLLGYVDRFGDEPQRDAVLIKADRFSVSGTGFYESIEEVEERLLGHRQAGRTSSVEYCERHIENLKWLNENRAWVEEESCNWIPFWIISSNMKVQLIILDAGNFEMFIHKSDLQQRDFSNLHVEVTSS